MNVAEAFWPQRGTVCVVSSFIGGSHRVLLSFAHSYGTIRSAASVIFSRVSFNNIPGEKGGDRFDHRSFTP
jgi:hypothetical protein